MTTPLKRQPRGEEPMEQRTYKLPVRCTAWLRRRAEMAGITEAYFLNLLISRAMYDEPEFNEERKSA